MKRLCPFVLVLEAFLGTLQEKQKGTIFVSIFLLQHIVSSFVSGDDHTLLGYFFPNTNSCGEEK